jgi:uncharacterized protein
MKLLITGATGFIGTALVKKLTQKGHIIHYLTTSKNKLENSENYKGFFWNPDTKEIDVSCFDGVEAIIHLAGASIAKRWTRSYRKEIISSRTETSNLLLTSLKEINHQVKHIISASGTAIYPESYDRVYDENDTETADDFLAKVVKVWENGISNFEYLGLKVAKIRTGVVYGKNGGAFQEIVKPIKFGFGAVMGNGKQIQSWIHLDDLVNLYCFVLENNLEGVYNAVAPETISNKDQTKAIAKKLHKPLFLPNIPRFIMKLILGEMSLLLFTSKNLSSKKIQEKGFQFKYPNFKSALNELI